MIDNTIKNKTTNLKPSVTYTSKVKMSWLYKEKNFG